MEALGLGNQALRRIPIDRALRMDVDALRAAYLISDHPMTVEQWAAERATVVNEVIDDTPGELPAPKKES